MKSRGFSKGPVGGRSAGSSFRNTFPGECSKDGMLVEESVELAGLGPDALTGRARGPIMAIGCIRMSIG